VSGAPCAGLGVHAVGPVGGVAIARLESAMEPPLMAVQPAAATETVVVAGVTAHAGSAALVTV